MEKWSSAFLNSSLCFLELPLMSSSLCSCLFGTECQAMRSSLPLLLAGEWQMQSGTMCHAVGCCTHIRIRMHYC